MPDLEFLSDPTVEPEQPSLARITDWMLGGTQNWEVDRVAGARLEAINPRAHDLLLESRLFLRRAVTYALDAGVRQFIDVGSGLPTMGSAHEVADGAVGDHDTTVVYIDIDPVTTAHSAMLLREQGDPGRHHAIDGDLLDPAGLWRRLLADGLIDQRRPACLLVNALLHFFQDEMNPAGHLARHRSQLAPGSLLVLSQATDEGVENDVLAAQAAEFHQKEDPGQMRGRAEIAGFFGDFVLVDPGITFAPQWRPALGERGPFATDPAACQLLAGVGRKP